MRGSAPTLQRPDQIIETHAQGSPFTAKSALGSGFREHFRRGSQFSDDRSLNLARLTGSPGCANRRVVPSG